MHRHQEPGRERWPSVARQGAASARLSNAREGGLGHGHLGNVGCRPDETSTVVADTHGSGVSSPANARRSSIEETRWTRESSAHERRREILNRSPLHRACNRGTHASVAFFSSRDVCAERFVSLQERASRALFSRHARHLMPHMPPGNGRALRSIRPGWRSRFPAQFGDRQCERRPRGCDQRICPHRRRQCKGNDQSQ